MRDSRSLLLALLSVGLITTWVYHLYDKSNYASRKREVFIKDSTAVAEAVSDSLKRIFTQSLNLLSTEKSGIDSVNNTLKGELGQRIKDINKLRTDIGDILKKKNITQSDLTEARNKIRELEQRIEEFRNENTSLANERKKLDGILAQLNGEMNSLQQSIQQLTVENKEMAQKINDASIFIASEIRFSAFNIRPEQKEIETSLYKKADKFIASFVVQNNVLDFPNAEVVIVITDPSGKTLNTEVWDSGSFDTKTEGKKAFTRKMKFEYNKAEAKRLIFTIQPDVFQKGIYMFSIYHNGIRIGESICRLN